MPTPGGLPKAGEVWKRTYKLPPHSPARQSDASAWETHTVTFRVVERGRGDYWSLRVIVLDGPSKDKIQLWVDASYWWQQGQLQLDAFQDYGVVMPPPSLDLDKIMADYDRWAVNQEADLEAMELVELIPQLVNALRRKR